ncbi:MAG: GlsB/YeaQ/YmgE family stress response membrane protein [Microbacteriaceae bacterium]
MGILAWIVMGLIAGAVAKLILPGKQGGGWIATLVLGVIGAFVGGFIGNFVFGLDISGFNFQTFLTALVGSLIVLLIYGFATRGSRR